MDCSLCLYTCIAQFVGNGKCVVIIIIMPLEFTHLVKLTGVLSMRSVCVVVIQVSVAASFVRCATSVECVKSQCLCQSNQ